MHTRRGFVHASTGLGLLALPWNVRRVIGSDSVDRRYLGWQPPQSDSLDCPQLRIEGHLPEFLRGTMWRNGPAVHQRHGFRYNHWFDGDGMIQEFGFSDSGISHRGRVIVTPKLGREDAEGRRMLPAFGTRIPDAVPIIGPDDMNVANISVLDHNDELLALWEGGSASILNRQTLAWEAFKVWDPNVKGMPFTAHPKVDSDGTVWAFGYAPRPVPMLVLYRISPDGQLVDVGIVSVEPMGMVHDFVITSRHIVVVIPPFVHHEEYGPESTFLEAHVWRPELGSRALIVSKDDFTERRWVQLPAGFGFHHGNAWEESDGTIRFDHCVAPDSGLVEETFIQVMRGEFDPSSIPVYTRFTIGPNDRVEIESAHVAAEFPVINRSYLARRNRFVYSIGSVETDWLPRTVQKRDVETGEETSFDYGEHFLAEEHLFVARDGASAEDDGWLVGTALDWTNGVTCISVFAAQNVDDGPVARGWLPYPLPLGFHGQFRSA